MLDKHNATVYEMGEARKLKNKIVLRQMTYVVA